MSSVAALILAHDDPAMVRRLIAALDGVDIFLHCDSKAPAAVVAEMTAGAGPRVRLVPRHRTAWASWSLVEAELAGLRMALEHSAAEHLIVLSGSCYPLVSVAELKDELLGLARSLSPAADTVPNRRGTPRVIQTAACGDSAGASSPSAAGPCLSAASRFGPGVATIPPSFACTPPVNGRSMPDHTPQSGCASSAIGRTFEPSGGRRSCRTRRAPRRYCAARTLQARSRTSSATTFPGTSNGRTPAQPTIRVGFKSAISPRCAPRGERPGVRLTGARSAPRIVTPTASCSPARCHRARRGCSTASMRS